MVFRKLSRVLVRNFNYLKTIYFLKRVILQTKYLKDIQNYLKDIQNYQSLFA